MKIALIVRHFHKRGGVARWCVEIAQNLIKMGEELHIFTYTSDVELKQAKFHKIFYLPFLKYIKNDKLKNLIEVPIFMIINSLMVYLQRKNFDIIFHNGESLIQDIYVAQSCYKSWLKLKWRNKDRKWIFYPLSWFLLLCERWNYSLKHTKRFIAISSVVKRDMMECYNIPDKAIEVIHSGVNLKEFDIQKKNFYKNKIRKKYKIKDNEVILLFVGYEYKRKGLDKVLNAMKLTNLGNIKLLVVGEDTSNIYKYKKWVNEDEYLKHRVIFAGTTSMVYEYFLGSDVFVFPTSMDAFGLVILEAMASGMCVITSSEAGASDLIENGKNGFILKDYNNIKEISNLILMLTKSKQKIKNIRKNARKTVINYSWENVSKRIYRVFKEIKELK